MRRVQDQVTIVTGAADGLGRAIALRLAEEGALLSLCDIDGSKLERTLDEIARQGGRAFGRGGSLTEEGTAQRRMPETGARATPNLGFLDRVELGVGEQRLVERMRDQTGIAQDRVVRVRAAEFRATLHHPHAHRGAVLFPLQRARLHAT